MTSQGKQLKIVCSSSMPFAKEVFSTMGKVEVVDGPAISPAHVKDADILAVRSTTRINRDLLEGSAVRFIGTATIGTDHIDIDYLHRAGIEWCYAPGCNANSVSEYIASALLCLAADNGLSLVDKTMGIVGVGNVGSLVAEKAAALGMKILCNDPPRVEAEGQPGPEFVELDQLLASSDFITMHVPLTPTGAHPTYHIADKNFFADMKPGAVFINAARGAVVDTPALLGSLKEGHIRHSVIDTWENEPLYNEQLLELADIGTPHIAGYSFEGKVAGTVMVYHEACRFLGLNPQFTLDALLPPAPVSQVAPDGSANTPERILWSIVKQVYDISQDDSNLRQGPSGGRRGNHFRLLRKNYRQRREFRWTRVRTSEIRDSGLQSRVRSLGFNTVQGR